MRYTENFSMYLPEYEDEIDVEQLNRNFKILDDQVENGIQTWGDVAMDDQVEPFLTMTIVAEKVVEEANLSPERSANPLRVIGDVLKFEFQETKRFGCIVDWGDGSLESILPITNEEIEEVQHTYVTPGEYVVNFYSRVPDAIHVMPGYPDGGAPS